MGGDDQLMNFVDDKPKKAPPKNFGQKPVKKSTND